MYLMPLKCTLKKVKMENFMLCLFYHDEKKEGGLCCSSDLSGLSTVGYLNAKKQAVISNLSLYGTK